MSLSTSISFDPELEQECSADEFRAWLKTLGFTDEGWIDDLGRFWPCDLYMPHSYIAAAVLDMTSGDAEQEADRRGWLRLSDYGNRTAARQLNQRQLDTLLDYCLHFDCDFQETLDSIEYL